MLYWVVVVIGGIGIYEGLLFVKDGFENELNCIIIVIGNNGGCVLGL